MVEVLTAAAAATLHTWMDRVEEKMLLSCWESVIQPTSQHDAQGCKDWMVVEKKERKKVGNRDLIVVAQTKRGIEI